MLMRTDPFRDFDRLAQQMLGTASRPVAMPMDAYRAGDTFVVHLDLPGIDPDSIDLDVERNVLTIQAERVRSGPEDAERIAAERPTGRFSRQLFLGDTLDVDRIAAEYDTGVLTLRIPVAETAKPRRIQISSSGGEQRRLTA